jgi:glycosyltransferase involved in cell wall biosynthesis
MEGVRVAYTLEQCWHRVPGGTAVSAIEVARAMPTVRADIDLLGVSGRHGEDSAVTFDISIDVAGLPISGPLLYETSLRLRQPRVERVLSDIDLLHNTSIIPFATSGKMVSTVHDLAFLHHPEFFTRHGNAVFARSLKVLKKRADMLLCSSTATVNDCLEIGFTSDRLRLVPLGVRTERASAEHIAQVRAAFNLPSEFILFVGTLEPRKNLAKLVESLRDQPDLPPLVVAGATGWGDVAVEASDTVKFLGHVEERFLSGLYAAASVMAYPSLWEGFGLPVLEAMAQGTPVVTSELISTQEVAGGAAVLVDPRNAESIQHGIRTALADRASLAQRGLERAAHATWSKTAQLTAAAYDEVIAQ